MSRIYGLVMQAINGRVGNKVDSAASGGSALARLSHLITVQLPALADKIDAMTKRYGMTTTIAHAGVVLTSTSSTQTLTIANVTGSGGYLYRASAIWSAASKYNDDIELVVTIDGTAYTLTRLSGAPNSAAMFGSKPSGTAVAIQDAQRGIDFLGPVRFNTSLKVEVTKYTSSQPAHGYAQWGIDR